MLQGTGPRGPSLEPAMVGQPVGHCFTSSPVQDLSSHAGAAWRPLHNVVSLSALVRGGSETQVSVDNGFLRDS